MARIAGVDLPRDKRVEIGLTYIYGIGRTSAIRILADAGVDPDTRVRDLTQDDVKKISEVIDETQVVEGDLRREIQLNIKRLKEIGCYRGIRHRKGLPPEYGGCTSVFPDTAAVPRHIKIPLPWLTKESECSRSVSA